MHDPVQAFRMAILSGLGYAPDSIETGRFHRFATSDRRGDSAGWCKLFDDMGGGVYGCYRQGISQTWSAADRVTMTSEQRAELVRQVLAASAEREAQQRQRWAENAQRIARMWAETVPLLAGDPVTLYLKNRGFAGVWPLPYVLRYHRELSFWDGGNKLGTYPAMVAPVVLNGQMVALHRTWLTHDGRKADVPTVRKLTAAAGPTAGACIPLNKPFNGIIGIAEGIETALAGWCASTLPTVAAYSARLLAAYRWPAGVKRIVIFADHDSNRTGQDAAETLRSRAVRAGLQVSVLMPTDPGADWADVWAARSAVGVSA